jgi:hypothetical protein
MSTDDTHLDHKIERDVVRENLKRRRWGYSAIELVLKHALDALDRKDARIAALEAEVKGIAENRSIRHPFKRLDVKIRLMREALEAADVYVAAVAGHGEHDDLTHARLHDYAEARAKTRQT